MSTPLVCRPVSTVRRALAAMMIAGAGIATQSGDLQAQSGTRSPRISEKSGYAISSWRINGFDHHNQMVMVRASVEGKSDGMVLFATEIGVTDEVIRGVTELGGEIMARFDEIGYFRARIPLKQFPAAERIPGVLIAVIDAGAGYVPTQASVGYAPPKTSKADSIRADSIAKDTARIDSIHIANLPPIPDKARTANNPYIAVNDMRSYDLRQMDPRFDGRGITIGILEYGTYDFLHPSLQEAKSIDGRTIPKLVGVINPVSYDEDIVQPDLLVGGSYASHDKNRVRRVYTLNVTEGTFTFEDSTFTAPNGRYSFGKYTHGKHWYGVIWDDATRQIWVDSDADYSFTDEQPMKDINVRHDIGFLTPLDSTDVEPTRTVNFAVSFDSIPNAMRVYRGYQSHQVMVASVAAGHNILGGDSHASAPGARIVIVEAGRSGMLYSVYEAWIRAARDPRVDVITSSQGGGMLFDQGESLSALIGNRLVEVYGKLLFASVGNEGPITTSGGEPSTIPRIFAIGGYVSAPTLEAHYGWKFPERDNLIHYSSRGPSANGGVKPDLVAPLLSVSANICLTTNQARRTYARRTYTFIYRFPECWQLGGGTSSASPHAAGAGALLWSAARQSDLPSDVRYIRWALAMGARYMPDLPAHAQGSGVVDVVGAYELLKEAKESGLFVPDIATRGPVNHRLAKFLRDPGVGEGMYLREGWTAGDRGIETVTLERLTGPAEPVTYRLGWRGNDGTFELVGETVTLPLNAPAQLRVRVGPTSIGIHSAQLLLIDQKTRLPIHQVMHTVIAADRFDPRNEFTVRKVEKVKFPHGKSFFLDVPEGTASLRLDLEVRKGRLQIKTKDATFGFPGVEWTRPYRYSNHKMDEPAHPGETVTHVIANPEPGVMEVLIQHFFPGPAGATPDSTEYFVDADYTLTASVQAAAGWVSAQSGSAVSSQSPGARGSAGNAGSAVSPQFTALTASTAVPPGVRAEVAFTNLQGAIGEGRIAGEVGARRVLHGTAGDGEIPTVYSIHVDSSTATLRVDVAARNPNHRLALYLYDCATGTCSLWDVVYRDSAEQSFLVVKPRAGTWKAVIEPVDRSGGQVEFTYTEIQTHPAFGTVEESIATTTGSMYLATVSFRPDGFPRTGYEWVGVADFIDEAREKAERENPFGWFPDHIPPYRPVRLSTVVIPIDIP